MCLGGHVHDIPHAAYYRPSVLVVRGGSPGS